MADKISLLKRILRGRRASEKIPTDSPANRAGGRRPYDSFQKSASSLYLQALAGGAERTERVRDYEQMDQSPEISTACNIYADDSTTYNYEGKILDIRSEEETIVKTLEELYFDILDIDFNLWLWVRNLVKYGDVFTLLDIENKYGVLGAIPLPLLEMSREEGYDGDPASVRFRWMTQSNQAFEPYQIAHFRLLGDDRFLPYGRSILDSGRRAWKQLILAIDAMLIYRISRAPERLVFKVDVGNIPPKDVDSYMNNVRDKMLRTPLVTESTGGLDMRYNPTCILANNLVQLLDGRTLTLEEIINERNNGKKNQWVYSIDRENNNAIVPGRVINAKMTRKNEQIIRIHLDNNTYIDTTLDHKFLLRIGEYIEAQHLKENDSLMPLYKNLSTNGYEMIYDPNTNAFDYTHKIVAGKLFQDDYCKVEKNRRAVVHHKNFLKDKNNKRNNNPDNLQVMSWHDHQKLHGDAILEYNKSEIGRENSKNRMTKSWKEGKLYHFTNHWNDKDKKNKHYKNVSELLSLVIDENIFIKFIDTILDNSTVNIKAHEAMKQINENKDFTNYLIDKNITFNNGFKDKLGRGRFSSLFKTLGYSGFTEYKSIWLLKNKIDINKIVNYCSKKDIITFRQIERKFDLNNTTIKLLIKTLSHKYPEFLKIKTDCNIDTIRGNRILNHKVTRIELLEEKQDVGCITVEKYGNFATIGSRDCYEHITGNESGIIIKNSILENFYIPIRGDRGSSIEQLPGGTNQDAIADVEFIQNQLFTSLGVPKAYLQNMESLGGKQTLCIDLNTKIVLAHSKTKTLKEIIDLFNKNELKDTIISYDSNKNRIISSLIKWAGITQRNATIYRVHFENGKYLDCTKNHELVTFEGKKIKLEDYDLSEPVKGFIDFNPINFETYELSSWKIKIVKLLPYTVDVGCITVDNEFHNFAIDAGIFIANSQEDIRFARTIQRVQKAVISELSKIGLIHLFLKGFDEDDIYNFELKLTNPSTVMDLMHLELVEKRFDISTRMGDSHLVSEPYTQKHVLGLTDDEIEEINEQLRLDAKKKWELGQIEQNGKLEEEEQTEEPADDSGAEGKDGESADSDMPDFSDENKEKPTEDEDSDKESTRGKPKKKDGETFTDTDKNPMKVADPAGTKGTPGVRSVGKKKESNVGLSKAKTSNSEIISRKRAKARDIIKNRKKTDVFDRYITDVMQHDRFTKNIIEGLKDFANAENADGSKSVDEYEGTDGPMAVKQILAASTEIKL